MVKKAVFFSHFSGCLCLGSGSEEDMRAHYAYGIVSAPAACAVLHILRLDMCVRAQAATAK